MESSLVSIIIPVYNRASMIGAAVDSVLAQTYRPIEIIIVDDGSVDDTPNVLRELQSRDSGILRVVTQANGGPGAARNKGLEIACGEYIQYLDSDDLLHPRKLECQVQSLLESPDAGVSYCITLRRNQATGQMQPWARTAEAIDNIFPSFLPKRGWATLTPLWRRSVCDQIGLWKSYRVMEDWEHDLRAGLLEVKPVHVPEALCTVVDHDQNRASGMNEGYTTERVKYLFLAHESIWGLMKQHGKTDRGYLEAFSRTMFWIARMCGERGLVREGDRALDYTDEMTRLGRGVDLTSRFRLVKRVLGWRIASRAGEWLRRRK